MRIYFRRQVAPLSSAAVLRWSSSRALRSLVPVPWWIEAVLVLKIELFRCVR